MNDRPSTTNDSRSRTGSAGRRRAVIIGAGLAVAAAIAVPLGLLAANNENGRDATPAADSTTPSPTNSPTPSPSPTPSDTPSPSTPPSTTASGEPQAWHVTGLSTGQPPAVAYRVGNRLHLPGRATLTIDPEAAYQLGLMSDGRWLMNTLDTQTGESTLQLRDQRWTLLGSFPDRDFASYALTPSGSTAAWARPDGTVLALQAGASDPVTVGKLPTATSAVTAVRGTSCATDCVIFGRNVDPVDQSLIRTWAMTGDSQVKTIGHGVLSVVAASDDSRAIGLTKITDYGNCYALLDLDADTIEWSTCDNTLDAFSPDGRLLLASEPYHDGWGSGEIAMYDAQTGRRMLDLLRDGPTFTGYQSAVWEDDTHLLVTTHADGAWAVVRIAVDGSMEYAVAPVPGNDMEPPFSVLGVLSTR